MIIQILLALIMGLDTAQPSNSPQTQADASIQTGLKVEYLGNASLSITGERGLVLIDPIWTEDFGAFQRVPTQAIARIATKNVQLVLVTHIHGDHFNAGKLAEFLADHPDAEVVAPQDVINALLEADNRLHERAHSVGDSEFELEHAGFNISATLAPHSGEQFANVANLAFLIEDDETSFVHVGDAETGASELDNWLSRELDGIYFPVWWFGTVDQYPATTDILIGHISYAAIERIPADLPTNVFPLTNPGRDTVAID